MSKIQVLDGKGAAVGEVEFPDSLLTLDKGEQAVHEVVVGMMAARRAGTASTLSKGEVAGSNKKPWRQKGTGRARAGYRQSPVWRGGGVAFGPKPRDFSKKINRKVGRLAFRRAFSERVAGGGVRVVEQIELAEPRTRLLAALLKAWQVEAPALIVVDRVSDTLALAVSNLPGVEVVSGANLNVYQVVRYPTLLVTREGLEAVKARLGDAAAAGEQA